jgi:hypothetical protein
MAGAVGGVQLLEPLRGRLDDSMNSFGDCKGRAQPRPASYLWGRWLPGSVLSVLIIDNRP